jgi:hypothetical protein
MKIIIFSYFYIVPSFTGGRLDNRSIRPVQALTPNVFLFAEEEQPLFPFLCPAYPVGYMEKGLNMVK